MPPPLDPGALLARHYALPDGTRVCLRLLRPRDQAGVRDLLRRHGRDPGDLDLARLIHFDPIRELVLVATALIGTAERVVGLGMVELNGEPREPALLLVDPERARHAGSLLHQALVGHADTLIRARAA